MPPLVRLCLALLVIAGLGTSGARAEVLTPAGGRVGLEPPPGFTPAGHFAGFENRALGATIIITELPAEAFPEVRESFTGTNAARALAARGVRLIGVEQPPGTIKDAVLVRAQQTAGNAVTDRFILLFPGPGYTGLITINRPQAAAGALSDAMLRQALLSAHASAAPVGDPVAALPFTFRESARLKVAQTTGGNSVVLANKTLPKDGPQPLFVITRGQDERPARERGEREAYAFRLLSSLQNFRNVTVTRQASTTLAGLDGIEIEASVISNDASSAPGTVLQIVLFETNGYYRLLGVSPEAMRAGYWPEFQAIVASFAPKR